MNLWLVFAETLENAEPSEDFRGRIVRIAELSRKVLTFPKNSAVRETIVRAHFDVGDYLRGDLRIAGGHLVCRARLDAD